MEEPVLFVTESKLQDLIARFTSAENIENVARNLKARSKDIMPYVNDFLNMYELEQANGNLNVLNRLFERFLNSREHDDLGRSLLHKFDANVINYDAMTVNKGYEQKYSLPCMADIKGFTQNIQKRTRFGEEKKYLKEDFTDLRMTETENYIEKQTELGSYYYKKFKSPY